MIRSLFARRRRPAPAPAVMPVAPPPAPIVEAPLRFNIGPVEGPPPPPDLSWRTPHAHLPWCCRPWNGGCTEICDHKPLAAGSSDSQKQASGSASASLTSTSANAPVGPRSFMSHELASPSNAADRLTVLDQAGAR